MLTPLTIRILIYITAFVFGIVIGSFVNVLIYRIPLNENIVTEHSHCMKCNHKLAWYDLVPLFSWVFLKGKCRYCKEKISIQYPLVELINGIGYVLIFLLCGINITSMLYAICFSMLVALSVIDWNTYEIPFGINVTIFVLGVINAAIHYNNIVYYLIGMACVSLFLLFLYIITGGRGIGGGDIKLMAAAGLLLGWKHIILALVLGCIIGSIIHIILMKVCDKGRMLAFGPYLSVGIVISMLCGEQLLNWYTGILFG